MNKRCCNFFWKIGYRSVPWLLCWEMSATICNTFRVCSCTSSTFECRSSLLQCGIMNYGDALIFPTNLFSVRRTHAHIVLREALLLYTVVGSLSPENCFFGGDLCRHPDSLVTAILRSYRPPLDWAFFDSILECVCVAPALPASQLLQACRPGFTLFHSNLLVFLSPSFGAHERYNASSITATPEM